MKSIQGLVVVGVFISALSGCSAEGSDNTDEASVAVRSDALLVTATALSRGTRRDYDGDGKEDVLIVDEDIGTYEILGKSPGGFNTSATTLIRTDWKPSNTFFAAGDFNHDGKTDLLVTTSTGTVEYTGKAGGGFNSNVWSNSTFKLISGSGPNFDIVVGDFNGDGFTDFIATTSTGSYLYTGKGTGGASGGFNANVWSKTTTAFKRGNVTITPGNFDTDATTDFIATTSTGSYLYTGTAGTGSSGGFSTNPVWSDTTLTNSVYPNVARFYVANINGVGADDFIVQTATGAYLYTAKTPTPATGPSFNANAWSQASLEITGTKLLLGDYNGDGCSDFLYQDGSALRIRTYKQGTPAVPGTFNPAVLVDTRFPNFYDASMKRADFTGDGKDDFIIQTRPTTGNGSSEFTGSSNAGSTATPAPANGGFTADVWTSSFYQGSAF